MDLVSVSSIGAILALFLFVLTASLPADAQPAGQTYRIGYLGEGRPEEQPQPLWDGLRELGYIEGRNLVIEQRYARFRYEQLPSLAAQLVQLKFRAYAEAGLLLSFGTSPTATNRRAAIYIDKILKGARPADLPVEEPRTFELIINLKTAKALGLTIPESVLIRADEILR